MSYGQKYLTGTGNKKKKFQINSIVISPMKGPVKHHNRDIVLS
jgi:hypothetical protein